MRAYFSINYRTSEPGVHCVWIRHGRSGAICRWISAAVAVDRGSAAGTLQFFGCQQKTHATDLFRAPDLHAREDVRADEIPRRTRAYTASVRARHVRRTSQGICHICD